MFNIIHIKDGVKDVLESSIPREKAKALLKMYKAKLQGYGRVTVETVKG